MMPQGALEVGRGKARHVSRQGQQLVTREQKITLGEMRAAAVCDLLAYCADYKCSHGMRMSADRWPVYVRLSVFPSAIKYRQSAASTEPAKIPEVLPTRPVDPRALVRDRKAALASAQHYHPGDGRWRLDAAAVGF